MLYLVCYLLSCLTIESRAQKISGKVIETNNGKTIGVGNIKVTVKDFSYEITNQQGEFEITIPTGKDYVKLNLENTNRQLISPFLGLVYLPPSDKVELIVCAQENKRLLVEVDKLNKKVKSFQTKYQLSEKKAALTYKEMMDTIVHYEQRIQILDEQKKQMESQYSAEVTRLQTEIDRLKSVEESLMRQLLEAKDDKFKKKQAVFQNISAGLRRYVDELQNLSDMLIPERISQYFTYDNRAAVDQLSIKINAYNKAYDEIIDTHDANITATRHYWEDEIITNQLENTYTFLLSEVHKMTVKPLEFSVNEALKKLASKELGRREAEKKAKESALDFISKIKVKKTALLEKVNESINILNQNF